MIFTTSKSWISKVIQFFTKGKVSHVTLEYWSNAWNGRWVAEAILPEVRKISSKKLRNRVEVVAEYVVKKDISSGMKSASYMFGEKYDLRGLFFFAWIIILWELLKVKIRKPLNNTKGMFCSELISNILKNSKMPETETWDPELISPQNLLEYCEKYPDIFQKV